MKPYGIIYKVINKTNGKIYIGQTRYTLGKRRAMHNNAAGKIGKCSRSNTPLHRAIAKYGPDNFEWSVVCECNNNEELNELEKFYINEFEALKKNGYNAMPGGGAGPWCQEAKDRASNVRKQIYIDNPELKQIHAKPLFDYRKSLGEVKYKEMQSHNSIQYWKEEENRKRQADMAKNNWKNATEEEKQKRIQGFIEYNEKQKTPEERARKSNIIKNSDAYRNSGHTAKMMEVCAHKIKVTFKNGTTALYDSKSQLMKALKISYNKLNIALQTGNPYNGNKYEQI